MVPRIPPQFDTSARSTEAKERDMVLRWFEGQGTESVAALYGKTPDEILAIIESPRWKKFRDEIRQRAIEYTLERFDQTAAKNLELLVELRDHSEDEKIQRLAALDLLEYSSLKKAKDLDGENRGAEMIRAVTALAKELKENKDAPVVTEPTA